MDKEKIIKALYQVEESIASGKDISNIILQAKIVASRLDSNLLKTWCHHELNGYHGVENIPDYRNVEACIELRYVANHYGSTISDTTRAYKSQLPQEYYERMSEEHINTLFSFRVNNSISDIISIQDDLRTGKRVLATPLESEIGRLFVKIQGHVYKEQYYIVCEGSQCASIVDKAKSHLLDITLSLQKDVGSASEFMSAKEQADELRKIANRTVTNHIYGEVKSMGDYYDQKQSTGIQNNQHSRGNNSMSIASSANAEASQYSEAMSKMLINFENETYENILANQELIIGVIKRIEMMEESLTDKIIDGEIKRNDLIQMLEPIWEAHVKKITDPRIKAFLKQHGPGMALKLGMKAVL